MGIEEFSSNLGAVINEAVAKAEKENAPAAKEEIEAEEGLEDSEETPEEEEEAEEEGDSEDEEDGEPAKEDPKEKEEKVESKKLKATLPDGSQVQITSDSVVKIKVDGNYIKVPVADLVSNYNGKVSHDERIRRSAEAEKAAKQKLDAILAEDREITDRLNNINKAFEEGDMMRVISLIAKATKGDKLKVANTITDGMNKFFVEYAKLSPAQREYKMKKYQLDEEQEAWNRKKNEEQEAQTHEEVRKFVKQACDTFDLTEDEIVDAQKVLEIKKKEDGGSYTLNTVVNTALEYKIFNHTKKAAAKLGIELDRPDYNYLIDMFKAYQKKNGTRLTEENFISLVQAYAGAEAKKISVGKSEGKKKTTPKSKKEPKELKRMSQLWE